MSGAVGGCHVAIAAKCKAVELHPGHPTNGPLMSSGWQVTAAKRKEAELRRAAYDLRLLIDTANAPIFGIDADGLVNEWNNQAAEITGYSKEEVSYHEVPQPLSTPVLKPSGHRLLQRGGARHLVRELMAVAIPLMMP